jgi:CheY-like chemotaxis protein/anti-sigma regulatory factor (Ser/Thr protein kinase)
VEFEKSPFNLASMLSKTAVIFHTHAKEKNLRFELVADKELNREVLGDITRLRQVLNNLLGNAVKFTEKGTVKLTASVAKQLSDKQCIIRFSVSDTGIGIDSSKMNKIFDSFTQADTDTTRKYGGTGLGLTISRRLLELMGSKLEVESKQGSGSKFSFELLFECNNKQTDEQKGRELHEMTTLDEVRVLVAEDNVINMMVVQRILEKWNIQVHKAENGKVALQKMQEQKFDLVLMDMEMPVMDGLTAVSIIRKTNADIPIIALTAASFDDMHTFLLTNGLNDYVQKPFRPEELHTKINKLVRLS